MANKASPVALALRSVIEEAGETAKSVAEKLNISASTLRSKLNGQSQLRLERPEDRRLVEKVAKQVGSSIEVVILRLNPESGEFQKRSEEVQRVSPKLLELYLDTMMNCEAPIHHRETARSEVWRMFKELM